MPDDKIMEAACEICRWPFQCRNEEELYQKCDSCPVVAAIARTEDPSIEINLYDQEEVYENCLVQVLKNSYTGAVSIGFWPPDQGCI